MDKVATLRSWAHARDKQSHHRIDQIGLCGKEVPRTKKKVVEIKARKPLFTTELVAELADIQTGKKMHPAKLRKLARERRRSELR